MLDMLDLSWVMLGASQLLYYKNDRILFCENILLETWLGACSGDMPLIQDSIGKRKCTSPQEAKSNSSSGLSDKPIFVSALMSMVEVTKNFFAHTHDNFLMSFRKKYLHISEILFCREFIYLEILMSSSWKKR